MAEESSENKQVVDLANWMDKSSEPTKQVKEVKQRAERLQTELKETLKGSGILVEVHHGKRLSVVSARALAKAWVKENIPNEEIRQIEAIAAEVFGSEELGHEWLLQPNLATFDRAPISLLGRADGYAHTYTLLRRIEHGTLT